MNIGDRTRLKHLQEPIEIYRGTAGKTEQCAKTGISWSLSREEAEKFGKAYKDCFHTDSYLVSKGLIAKNDIIALINSNERLEKEVIVNPEKIYKISHKEYPF